MPAGRPSEYTDQVAAQICEELADGKSLVQICKADDMPNRTTVYDWLIANPSFADRYARARETQAEKLAEEIISIADESDGDYGFKEAEDKDGKGAKEVFLAENVQRSKLRVDARKWVASKLYPKKYGDFQRNEITGKDGGPLQISLADQIRGAHGE